MPGLVRSVDLQVPGRPEGGTNFKQKPVCRSCQEIIACAQKKGLEVILCPPSTEEDCKSIERGPRG
jgi:hypothetical protein